MKKSKGCFNKKCQIFNEKKFIDISIDYCPKCGGKLYYVCKHDGCYKKIENNEKYCATHKELHKNKIHKIGKGIAGVAGAVASVIFIAKGIKK